MMIDLVRKIVTCCLTIAAVGLSPSASLQAPSPADSLSRAAQRGKDLVAALRGYSYYAELTIQTVSQADTLTGKYYRFSQFSFDRDDKRVERALENTSNLPADVHIGASAANNLTRVYQFIITPEIFTEYELNYVGRERLDELDTLVFDVKPRIKLPDPQKSHERHLRGRVWIDEQDLCVVKIAGEALPEQRGRQPAKFETYFQNYDRYWFPAYTVADDSIRAGRDAIRVTVNVRFTGYKKVSPKR